MQPDEPAVSQPWDVPADVLVVPIFGGRNFTVWSTAMLLLPTLWIGFAVQDPTTNYAVVRAQQDLRGGEAGVSLIGTAVNRARASSLTAEYPSGVS